MFLGLGVTYKWTLPKHTKITESDLFSSRPLNKPIRADTEQI